MYTLAPNMDITRMPTGAENPFTVISNDENSFAMDRRLTSSAKGILFTVFTLCERSWHFSVEGLCSLMKDGETKIRAALKELEKLGYYVTEQIKDEKGRYQPTKYYFYESVKLNDRKDAAEQNGLFSSLCPDLGFPDADIPDVDFPNLENPAQSNTNILNTKESNTKSVSQSVSGLTDGLSGTENQVAAVTEIPELEIMFTGITEPFAVQVKQYLTEMISTGKISKTKTVNAEELLQKIWTVYTENELPVFLKKLESVCTGSLKNLKYANAKDSYLKSVIAEFAVKYTSESRTEKQNTEYSEPVKSLDFREMLKEMHYPDEYDLDSEIFESEDTYAEYFCDEDEEELKMCVIPDSFRNNPETMERALKFLGRYQRIRTAEYRSFVDETYRSLAKIICTGKAGRNKAVNAEMLIRRLNEINADVYDNDDSIEDFVQSFHDHFDSKIAEYSAASNKKAYMESMLVSFLDGEYQEMNIRLNMLFSSFPESIEENSSVTETTQPEPLAEDIAELCAEEMADITDTTETATESSAEESEESTEPDYIMSDEEVEKFIRGLFGNDISDEQLQRYMITADNKLTDC